MPCLKNTRHERFAQGIARGKSQGDAYLYAGYGQKRDGSGRASADKDLRSNASQIALRPDVAARIAELQEKAAERCGVTVDKLLVKLEAMYMLSKRIKQPSAGVGAVLAQAKLLGLVTDKVEVNGTIRKPSSEPTEERQMTLAEWQEKFAPRPPGALQ